MKKITLAIVPLLFLAINLKSQSGNETSELGIVHKGPGKVILLNGEEVTGTINYDLTSSNKVRVYIEGVKKPSKFVTKEVKEFFVNDEHFVRIKGVMVETFATILNNPKAKILLLKSTYQKSTISGGSSETGYKYPTGTSYYVYFAEKKFLKPVDDMSVTNKKLAKLTADCAELSKEIAAKSKEYKIGMMTPTDKRIEILTAISEAYENCDK
ncbi:MAG: hypothetical protein ABFS35_00275 [Bacteroidota bacterium]